MDNFFRGCPPMMNDRGRNTCDFKTPTRREEYIKYINNIVRDDDYRLFLQQNGNEFMDKEWQYYKTNNSCYVNDCVHKYPTRQSPLDLARERQLYDSRHNANNATFASERKCKAYADYRLSDSN
jgi:hypothetical protein